MIRASEYVVGTFDFTSFAASDPERTARITESQSARAGGACRSGGVAEQDRDEVLTGIGLSRRHRSGRRKCDRRSQPQTRQHPHSALLVVGAHFRRVQLHHSRQRISASHGAQSGWDFLAGWQGLAAGQRYSRRSLPPRTEALPDQPLRRADCTWSAWNTEWYEHDHRSCDTGNPDQHESCHWRNSGRVGLRHAARRS